MATHVYNFWIVVFSDIEFRLMLFLPRLFELASKSQQPNNPLQILYSPSKVCIKQITWVVHCQVWEICEKDVNFDAQRATFSSRAILAE